MLDFFGFFNPVIGHRHHRVLRQHLPLLEFLTALTANAGNWLPTGPRREALTREAVSRAVAISALGADYRPLGELIDERAIVNAVAMLMATHLDRSAD